MGINGPLGIKKGERRVLATQSKVDLVEGADCSDIPPIASEIETVDGAVMDRVGNNVTSEIVKIWIVAQELNQDLCVEKINSHRTEVGTLFVCAAYKSG